MIFIQHIPSFSDCEPYKIEVENTESLLSDPRIKDWTKEKGFDEFRVFQNWDNKKWNDFSDGNKSYWKGFENGGWHLMACLNRGENWYVVGTSNEALDLPIWGSNS